MSIEILGGVTFLDGEPTSQDFTDPDVIQRELRGHILVGVIPGPVSIVDPFDFKNPFYGADANVPYDPTTADQLLEPGVMFS